MGKSTSSCCKIISCGADSTDYDDLSPEESKALSDKRRWSFRKRSARHQAPSNTVISKPQDVGYDKENPEATTNNFYSAKDSSIPKKNTVIERVNKTAPLSSAVVNSEVTDTLDTGKITTSIDANLQEYVVVIQAAIRRFLAQRELQKLNNVVKLQAVVRGHLVRRQAVGTLRCVLAIVKMQALVRARRARLSLEKCAAQENLDEKIQIDSQLSTLLVKRNSKSISNKTYHTTKKLLSDGFACRLLEATPKTKPIHISCDPLRPDSAWQWLERWMAVTSSEVGQQQDLNGNQGYRGEEEYSKLAAYEELNVIPVKAVPISSESNLSPIESAAVEGERDSITDNSGKFEFQAPVSVPDQCFSSSAKDDREQSQGEDLGMSQENFTETGRVQETSDPVSSLLLLQLDATSQCKPDNNSNEPEFVTENLKCTSKRGACHPMETEGKKFELGLRKARNPAFAAVQAKFEELSSAPKASRSISHAYRDAEVESKLIKTQADSKIKTKEFSSTANSITQNSVVQVAASECGTVISISSTLDSPDRSEADGGEIVLEFGTSEEGNVYVNSGASNAYNLENMNAEAKQPSTDSKVFQRQRPEENDGNVANSIAVVDSVQVEQHLAESTTSGIQIQLENLKDPHTSRSSPEGSPRSHVTVPESHGTPSSQVSVHTKTSKSENNIPARKLKTKLVSKSSPSNLKNDSGQSSSTEHLPKDAKNAKRRSSFRMAKLDHLDHEPRLSISNSLPSYMQATESARAKAHGSVSLKSSPDVHDKDNSMKKRHSLPIEDGKQGSSPRVQRSTSQAQQSLKGTQSPHNSAEKRWQR